MNMGKMKILELASELSALRDNPLLVLNLPEIATPLLFEVEDGIHGRKFNEIDVVLQTPGGDIDVAYGIVKLLRSHAKRVNIIVPYFAKSAGTLVCLGGDKILMTEISELGPLDTQIRQSHQGDVRYKSALDGFKALEQIQIHALENLDIATKLIVNKSGLKMLESVSLGVDFSGKTSGCLYNQLDPLSIGEYKRALEIGQEYGKRILIKYKRWPTEKAEDVVRQLVYSYPSHSFVIDIDELSDLGIRTEKLDGEEDRVVREMRLHLIREEEPIVELIEKPAGRRNNKSNSKKSKKKQK